MPENTDTINTEKLRQELIDLFDDDGLDAFCYDNYHEVSKDFTSGMSKRQKIQILIGYCRRTKRVAHLGEKLERYKRKISLSEEEISPPEEVRLINRKEELEIACGNGVSTKAPGCIIFTAPYGYGKTTLMKAIAQDYQKRGWFCTHTEASKEADNALQLAISIVRNLGIPIDESLALHEIATDLAVKLAMEFATEPRKGTREKEGILLLIDGIERLPDNEVETFFDHFLQKVREVLYRTVDTKIILSVRYQSSLRKSALNKKFSQLMSLPLLPLPDVKEALLNWLVPLQENTSTSHESYLELAANLMHITGGHPASLVQIIEKAGFNSEELSAETYLSQERFTQMVLSAAHEIRASVPSHLRDIFDTLSVFRRYNSDMLEHMIKRGIINEKSSYKLEREILQTLLVERTEDFLEDRTVRRLLALRLRLEEPARFVRLSHLAAKFYWQGLRIYKSTRFAIETLYQTLQWRYYQGDQSLAARAALTQELLEEGGILHRCIRKFSQEQHKKGLLLGFKSVLDVGEDWEFRFAFNFFQRQQHYTDDPYQLLCQRVTDIYRKEGLLED